MLAIGIELLAGRYVATAYNDRGRAEWPPHPARLFSALVATWAETNPRDEVAARALAWLAEQPPPRILASASEDVAHRSVMTTFVPVNDTSVVSSPERDKLDAALDKLASAQQDKARVEAAREVERLEVKLKEATAKAIAKPAKFNKSHAKSGAAVLPESRPRQPRTFPCVTPRSTRLGFLWPSAQPSSETVEILGVLLGRLVRLGHSSSFIAARILREHDVTVLASEVATYSEASDGGEHVIRWVGPRQLQALEKAFQLHQETEPRVLPAVFVTYGDGEYLADTSTPSSVFDSQFIVLARVGGPRLPITAIPGVSRRLRYALMSAVGNDIPELLSGHKPDGSPSDKPHIAVVPLPVVGGPHADGALLGVALVLPRETDASDRKRVLAAIWKLKRQSGDEKSNGPVFNKPVIELQLGKAGKLELQLDEWGESPQKTLRTFRWTKPSRLWATATPVALDRNPGDLHAASHAKRAEAFAVAEETIAKSIQRIGLPLPLSVEVRRSCVLSGSAKPTAYGPFPADPKKPQRVLVHAQVEFDCKVPGPVLVGAGRYQGMGLFLPMDDERARS